MSNDKCFQCPFLHLGPPPNCGPSTWQQPITNTNRLPTFEWGPHTQPCYHVKIPLVQMLGFKEVGPTMYISNDKHFQQGVKLRTLSFSILKLSTFLTLQFFLVAFLLFFITSRDTLWLQSGNCSIWRGQEKPEITLCSIRSCGWHEVYICCYLSKLWQSEAKWRSTCNRYT